MDSWLGFLAALVAVATFLYGVFRGAFRVFGILKDPHQRVARHLGVALGMLLVLFALAVGYYATQGWIRTGGELNAAVEGEKKKGEEALKSLRQEYKDAEGRLGEEKKKLQDDIEKLRATERLLNTRIGQLEKRIAELRDPQYVQKVDKENVNLKDSIRRLTQERDRLSARLGRFEKKDALLSITVLPPGARVSVDGEDLGTNTMTGYAVNETTHWVRARIPDEDARSAFYHGYAVKVQSDKYQMWPGGTVALAQKSGSLKVVSYDGRTGQPLPGTRGLEIIVLPVGAASFQSTVFQSSQVGQRILLRGGLDRIELMAGVYRIIGPAGSIPLESVITVVGEAEVALGIY